MASLLQSEFVSFIFAIQRRRPETVRGGSFGGRKLLWYGPASVEVTSSRFSFSPGLESRASAGSSKSKPSIYIHIHTCLPFKQFKSKDCTNTVQVGFLQSKFLDYTRGQVQDSRLRCGDSR